jgi:hypothetical protein
MSSLFRRLQPRQKFRIAVRAIAQLLKIPKRLIVRVECWAYVVFIHRGDKGGQFISYRQLEQWQNAVAYQIQNCSTWQQLRSLWLAIEEDYEQHENQYNDEQYQFLCKIWTKCWDLLWNDQELAENELPVVID